MLRAAIYTRVSSEEQLEGHSLSAQAEIVRHFCTQRGWKVVQVYEERGRSGKNALRPEFQQMIRHAEAGLFDVVIVHKLDRFSRSLQDVLYYIKHLNDLKVSFVSVNESFDFTTPTGKVQLVIMAAIAEWYLDNLSQETIKGKKERARQGGWNGTLAFGYTTPGRLNDMLTDLGEQFQAGELAEEDYSRLAELVEGALEKSEDLYAETDAIICPINGPGVVLAFEKYSLGIYSDLDIANILTEAGYRTSGQFGTNPFGKDTATYLLQNRFYIGETSYQGKKDQPKTYLPGRHEPLISRELFEKCMEVRATRAANFRRGLPKQEKTYPLSSILVCANCGNNWRGWNLRNGRRYRDPAKDKGNECPSALKSVAAEVFEDKAAEILLNLEIPQDWKERVMALIVKDQPQYTALKSQNISLQGRLEKLK